MRLCKSKQYDDKLPYQKSIQQSNIIAHDMTKHKV